MKSITLFTIYLLSFMLFYFLLSLIGLLWYDYVTVIQSQGWFLIYAIFIGSWMAIFPAREYYLKYEEEFNLIF